SHAIAGEERDGTIALLLANPISRRHVLLSKAGSLAALTALTAAGLWAAILGSAAVLDVSIEGMHVGALALHLFFSSLLYGCFALAVGAWTGNRSGAAGAAAGLMIISFLAVGILPLLAGAKGFVRIFPWHYFDGSDPLINGVDWSHIAVLGAASTVLVLAGIMGVDRRDLKSRSVGVTLIDRLRAHPLSERIIGRLAGSARVSDIWVKTASEYQALFLIVAIYTFFIQGLLLGPIYNSMPRAALDAMSNLPHEMLALFGGGDISTVEGFYQLETYGMMAPVLVMILAIAVGAGALAGEEQRKTMGLLLANPVRRSRVVLEKAAAMVFYAVLVGFVTFAGVALGSLISNLGMDIGNVAAAGFLQTLVGLVFGALALALSAATGRKNVAIFGAVGAGLALHLLNGLGDLSPTMAGFANWSPFHYYLGNDPLNNGMDWSNAAVLAALAAVLIGLSVPLFERRDLR
ncbi:MAG TPA: ABC transporter permease subunit, partial [Thermoleophilia bacterium]|nr:ABC transporter permease subunit [Thermoleophilia bacterium]